VLLLSDSQYTLKGISEWRRGWQAKGMRTASGGPVANPTLWLRLWALVDERKVTTRWVKGHNGDLHNERCDVLAGDAIRTRAVTAPRAVAAAVAGAAVTDTAVAAAKPAARSQAGGRWTPLAEGPAATPPADTLVLYGQIEAGCVLRAESGPAECAVPWATHWTQLPRV
jgi:hypothetical protein